jgi:hypothetical protein
MMLKNVKLLIGILCVCVLTYFKGVNLMFHFKAKFI